MKKLLATGIAFILMIGFFAPVGPFAGDKGDYDNSMLHITIKDMKTGKVKTNINVPLALLDWAMQMGEVDDVQIGTDCKLDWAKLASALKRSKNNFLVEIEAYEENKSIKIWID